jgi:hypothetical protein
MLLEAPASATRVTSAGFPPGTAPTVCNAEKLIHFTAVKMSQSGLVLFSLFCEFLNV